MLDFNVGDDTVGNAYSLLVLVNISKHQYLIKN